jgi:FixJ family two-component response regulator
MHNGFVSFRSANLDRDMGRQRAQKTRDSIVDDHESVREATTDLIRVMGFIVEAFQHVDDFSNLTAATAHPA